MPRDFVDSGARGKKTPGGRDIWSSTPGLDHNLRMSRLMCDRVPDDALRPFNDTHSPLSSRQCVCGQGKSLTHQSLGQPASLAAPLNFSSESFRSRLRRSFYE